MPDQESLAKLQAENARLVALLESHGIDWRPPPVAAAVIAHRRVNTLVLVHRTELLKQWQERLQAFLAVDKKIVGTIGGGKARPTGNIDIAVMQSLSRQGEVNALVENYWQVIVDECHHVGAVSFDAILRRTKAKYVLGLTAGPDRDLACFCWKIPAVCGAEV